MYKQLFLAILCIVFTTFNAQIPANYYDSANGLSNAALKSQLRNIISGHIDHGYGGLWTAYATTDRDYFYENDGSILDIYSEKPTATDPYNFTLSTNQCNSAGYTNEGDCYNREHIVPQSLFNSASPMVSDIHFIRPTDGKVNNYRNNYPFGNVATSTYVSLNGSKLGSSASIGYTDVVFEPINEFKGDVARMIFYFVTRYENELPGFTSGSMLSGNTYPGITTWELNTLLAWHNQDPVSNVEIARNNSSYQYQGNRNPYIDHPEYVQAVWGNITTDTEVPTAPSNLATSGATSQSLSLSWTAATDNVGVASYDVYVNGVFYGSTSNTTLVVNGLTASTTYTFFVIAKDAAGNVSTQSNTASGTTLAATSTGGGCGLESFENIPNGTSTSYTDRSWISNNITWTANNARTDQTINAKSICYRNGTLASSTFNGGVQSITLTTQLKFSGSVGTLNVLVNGANVGTVPYSSTVTTTTIHNINVTGNADIKIVNPHATNRVAVDDLSWTCTTMSTSENALASGLVVVPNPVKEEFMIKNPSQTSILSVELIDGTGRVIKTLKTSENYNVSDVAIGNYLLKINTKENSKLVKLIKK